MLINRILNYLYYRSVYRSNFKEEMNLDVPGCTTGGVLAANGHNSDKLRCDFYIGIKAIYIRFYLLSSKVRRCLNFYSLLKLITSTMFTFSI